MTEKKIQMMIDSYRKTVCALCPHRTLCNSLPDDVSCETVWKLRHKRGFPIKEKRMTGKNRFGVPVNYSFYYLA